jgi:hypothetical protein
VVPKISSRSPTSQLQDFHGLLVPHSLVNDIQSVARSRSRAAHEHFILPNLPVRCRHIADMPQMRAIVRTHEDLLHPMFSAVRQWKHIVHQKSVRLAMEYAERHVQWMVFCHTLDAYAAQARQLVAEWPPEFLQTAVRPTLEMADPNVSPMYLDAMEAVSFCMWDQNRFVEDPLKEHNAFRKRLYWAEGEVTIFLEKYAQHPKDFKRIATALPNKSVKDVIEFYFIQRIALNLKDIEVAARKRGRKKMLVTRGTTDQ